MGKYKYNHESDNFAEATGVDKNELTKKVEGLFDKLNEKQIGKRSELVEEFENTFTKRELAVWAQDMADTLFNEGSSGTMGGGAPSASMELLATILGDISECAEGCDCE